MGGALHFQMERGLMPNRSTCLFNQIDDLSGWTEKALGSFLLSLNVGLETQD
jgi:hypothetical protein